MRMSEMTDAYVKLDKVSKIYGTKEVKIVAVDEISFEIAKGEFVVIVGPSGAGKTTVLNILGGMDQATSGEVLVDGRNIARYNSRQLTGYRRNDIHPIVKDDLSILVFTETKFIHLVCRTEHGIKIVKEKRASRCSGSQTCLCTINLCSNGIPGANKVAEKVVVIPAFPSFNVYNLFHIQKRGLEKRMPLYGHPFYIQFIFLSYNSPIQSARTRYIWEYLRRRSKTY